MAAMIKPVSEGKNIINNDEARLQITEMTSAFFLPVVSANTEVGKSKRNTVNDHTFAIKMICTKDSPVYL